MDILRRSMAPLSEDAWNEIDEQARRYFRSFLSARRLVDISGPHGWAYPAAPTGRLTVPKGQETAAVRYGIHNVQPLVETRASFTVDIWEMDNITRGLQDPDFSALETAARESAGFEERAVYLGFKKGAISGLSESAGHEPVKLGGSAEDLLQAVSRSITQFAHSGVQGPYTLVLDRKHWQQLSTYVTGYPLRAHIQSTIGGEIVLSNTVDANLVVSTRGGDFELILGQDFSIGYESHDTTSVHLYFTESFTFRVLDPAAVIVLKG
ncbi:MAG: bacteriocin [Spirochaetaceae bacterium]|nr:MAG: bacteriocin [Spirochaetaceae bacterium]